MFSIIYSIYNLPQEGLELHLKQWENMSEDTRRQTELILVDDCSETPLEFNPSCEMNLTIARVEQDVYWNLGGARNVGFHLASGEYVFTGDQDHLFTNEDELRKAVELSKQRKTLYLLNRYRPTYVINPPSYPANGLHKPHPNSFVTHRQDFIDAGGYDEDLTGHRGFTDHMMQQAMLHTGFHKGHLEAELTEHSPLTVSDPEHFKNVYISRAHNRALVDRKLRQIRQGTYSNQPNMRIPWHVVRQVTIK